MGNNRILTNREWQVNGSWFAPRDFLRDNFSSVVFCDHFNTSSSAGDWEGFVLQQFGRKVYVTLFTQENCYPDSGFQLTTSKNPFMEFLDVGVNPNYRELFDIATQAVNDIN